MFVELNGSGYDMSRKKFVKLVEAAKEACKEKITIVAIEKAGRATMTNDIYPSKKALTNAVLEYKTKGFKVHYTIPKEV